MNYSISDYLRFINELDKHINPETAKNIIGLSFRLLDDLNPNEDIRKVNFESIVDSKYPKESVTDKAKKMYIGRMNSGLRYYTQFVNGEAVQVTRGARANRFREKTDHEYSIKNEETQIFSLPIPLRDSFIVNITNLPLNLTEEEAEKISRIIKSYAVI